LGLALAAEGRRLAEMGGGDTRPRIPLQPPDGRSLSTRSIARRRAATRGVHDARPRLLFIPTIMTLLAALARDRSAASRVNCSVPNPSPFRLTLSNATKWTASPKSTEYATTSASGAPTRWIHLLYWEKITTL